MNYTFTQARFTYIDYSTPYAEFNNSGNYNWIGWGAIDFGLLEESVERLCLLDVSLSYLFASASLFFRFDFHTSTCFYYHHCCDITVNCSVAFEGLGISVSFTNCSVSFLSLTL